MPRSDKLTRLGRKMLHPQCRVEAVRLRYQNQNSGCSMSGSGRFMSINFLVIQGVDMPSHNRYMWVHAKEMQ